MNQCVYQSSIDDSALACIAAAFADIISGGADTVSAVVYTPITGSASTDPSTGTTARTIQTDPVSGSFGVLDLDLVESDTSPYDAGDVMLCVVKTDLTVAPIAGDSGTIFEVDSIQYSTITAETGQWDNHYTLVGRVIR